MSAPDVLEALAGWCNGKNIGREEYDLRSATYAAVAELIAAANRALPVLAAHQYKSDDDMGAHEALRAALARIGGAP